MTDLNQRAAAVFAELAMWRRRIASEIADAVLAHTGEVTARDVVGWWREYPYLLPERTAAIRIAREVLNDRALRGELMCERRPTKPGYGQGAAANVYRRAGG